MSFNIESYRDLYPFESHWFDIDGLRMHYLDEGQGEVVVCVHGNPTWSFYYRELVKALRPSYRVIVPDHIGCGLSDKPDDSHYTYVLQRRIDDLERLLEGLGVRERATLVVHDWGGMIGLGWALRDARRLARLVVLNTSAFLKPADKRLPWQLWVVRNVSSLGAPLVRGFNAFARGAARLGTSKGMSRRIRNAYCAPYDSWRNRLATLRFAQDIPLKPGDVSYDAARFVDERFDYAANIPVMICWGKGDFVFDRHFLKEFRRRLPAAEVHKFPDAGHYCLEDAGDEIIPLVQDFLARHPLPAASPSNAEAAS
jgi:pimeloyl-ACP methyl ester carboxylesterase